MPKATHSNAKGLVQAAGAGFGIAGTNNGAGLYTFAKEFDLEGTTPGADKLHMKSICTLPAGAVITRLFLVCTEDVAPNNTTLSIDVAATSSAIAAGASDEANITEIIAAEDIKNDNAGDHHFAEFSGANTMQVDDVGNGVNICIRNGASNTATIL